MTTACNIVLETPVPHADERTHVLAGEPLVVDKKVLTEVINEESELAKKCGGGANFEKWCPEPIDTPNCDGIPVTPSKRVDIPTDKGIFG